MADQCFVAILQSFLFWALSLSLLLSGGCFSFFELDSSIVVSTKVGFVQGEIVDLNTFGVEKLVITQFLGIPYSEPPVGKLRFKKPQKKFDWMLKGVLNATVVRPHCGANDLTKHHISDETFTNDEGITVKDVELEDCLYINIYVPGNLSLSLSVIDTMELPVLVMLAEDEEDNRAALDIFRHLASYCKVVVVDISYRSGVLSYLTLADGKVALGNNGFYDQNLALLWVWDNIREFGGNPEEITVFAEFDASFNLAYHILQPESRNVIARAILHSGTFLTPGYFQNDNPDASYHFTSSINYHCNSTITVIDCLQAMSLKKLLMVSDSVWENFDSWKKHTFHQQHLSSQPLNHLSDGHFNQIDLLIGFNENDGHCLLKKIFKTEALTLNDKVLESVIKDFLKNIYAAAHRSDKILKNVFDALMLEYSSCYSFGQNATRFLSELIHDMIFRAPAELTARLASNQENKVYLYSLSNKNYDCKGLKSLIQFKEDNTLWNSGQRLTESIADMLMNFVKYGNPNPLKKLDDWKPFSEADRNIVIIANESKWLQHTTKERKMAFWNDYFPYLLQSDSDSCPFSSVTLNSTLIDNNENNDLLWLVGFMVGVAVLFLVFLCMMLCIYHQKNTQKFKCIGLCCHREHRADQSLIVAANSDETRVLHPLPYSDE